MKPLRIAVHGLLVPTVAVLLFGCANSTPGQVDAPTATTTAASTPSIEGTGPEKPQPSQSGQPSVNLARLPVGGGFTGDENGNARCVGVSWLAGFPKGVRRISVSGMTFAPQGVFKAGGNGCGSQQSGCTAFTADHPDCQLSVVQVKDADITVTLTLRGTVSCTDQRSCADFVKSAAPGSISLQAQPGNSGSTTPTS